MQHLQRLFIILVLLVCVPLAQQAASRHAVTHLAHTHSGDSHQIAAATDRGSGHDDERKHAPVCQWCGHMAGMLAGTPPVSGWHVSLDVAASSFSDVAALPRSHAFISAYAARAPPHFS